MVRFIIVCINEVYLKRVTNFSKVYKISINPFLKVFGNWEECYFDGFPDWGSDRTT